MLLQPFTSLLEECAAAASSNRLKNLTGDIQDLSESMTPENLKALDAAHDGIYAFLAFDPTVDVEIRNYLLSPSAGRDSGKNILLLFTTSVSAGTSPSAAPSDYPAWLVVNGQTHVSNEIAREAFASSSTSLQFPGVLFMERMGEPTEPIFVSLAHVITGPEITAFIRGRFHDATRAWSNTRSSKSGFVTQFATSLAAQNVSYVRGGSTSVREWLVRSARRLGQFSAIICTLVSLFK